MSKKVFGLVTGIVGGLSTVATAIVAYLDPSYTPAIIAAIGLVNTATVEICSLFRRD